MGPPPYIYSNSGTAKHSPYSEFNPRAYSQATFAQSYTSLQSQKPKNNGPLINFNAHPDSYMVVGYSQSDATPMKPNTKKQIITMRWVQFALRLLQLMGAAGLLFCVITLKGVQTAQGWLLRIPPAWDTLISAYAVYHLLRPAKGRTPASSASYHFFALIMDCCLIPFYAFMAVYGQTNATEANNTSGRWGTLFSSQGLTNDILEAMWIMAVAVGGFHALSIFLDAFLLVLFRKINRLPPDMNPLEDNLTSRSSKHKHKHKNSELSNSTMADSEKRLSGSTLNLYNPSKLSLAVPDPNNRQVPFGQSRTNLDAAYSPHTLDSARQSRANLQNRDSFHEQSGSERTSRADVQRPMSSRPASRSRSRPRSYVSQHHDPMPDRINSPQSFVSAPSDILSRYSSPAPQSALTNSAVQKQQGQGLLNDNWYVVDDGSDSPRRGNTPKPQYHQSVRPHDETQYRHAQQERREILPQPLSSNPPIPPKSSRRSMYEDEVQQENDDDIGRALTMGSSIYSDSASVKSAGTPKSKYYGNLQAATMGVRGAQSSPPKHPLVEHRAVSRTGVDIADANVMYYSGGDGRARHVSGKAAEEGMGGWGMRKREVSGAV